jgi:transposase InsO family protein
MVIDAFVRQVISWSLRQDVTRNIVIDALRMAWFKRQPVKPLQQGCHPASAAIVSGTGLSGFPAPPMNGPRLVRRRSFKPSR